MTKLNLEHGMLTFSRSLQISEGVFNGIRHVENDKKEVRAISVPVEVLDKGVRGQSSEDNAKNAGKSNPQVVEFAAVPGQCTQLSLTFSIRVLPKSISPHACGDSAVGDAYKDIAKAYSDAGGYHTLAALYVWNLANGRFAWRNRFQADVAVVKIEFDGRKIAFSPFGLDLDQPEELATLAKALVEGDRDDLDHLVSRFANALAGTESSLVMSVEWLADMLPGQEVFPSQEYVREETKRDDTSRVYAKLPTFRDGRTIKQASMHSQKIGAALRHIDVWHGDSRFGAIAVNPFGGVQETSDVLRDKGTKRSFYDIRKKPEVLLEGITSAGSADAIHADAHFFMANLVRGGVFGAAKAKKEA